MRFKPKRPFFVIPQGDCHNCRFSATGTLTRWWGGKAESLDITRCTLLENREVDYPPDDCPEMNREFVNLEHLKDEDLQKLLVSIDWEINKRGK